MDKHQKIAERAYYLSLENPIRTQEDNWFKAEEEIKKKSSQTKSKPYGNQTRPWGRTRESFEDESLTKGLNLKEFEKFIEREKIVHEFIKKYFQLEFCNNITLLPRKKGDVWRKTEKKIFEYKLTEIERSELWRYSQKQELNEEEKIVTCQDISDYLKYRCPIEIDANNNVTFCDVRIKPK